ncbi:MULTISPECIES: hypothetical protein [Exiguobacterium]|jgi:hypothetical protein|uniref:Uncharacterized protein n=1 Tax=Exiguobacterium mexicanum TaxID=340146 RepID=A0ABT7MST7_9BACL|nr:MULTISPECIES: hypothetical protein [Exiguobacterium]MDL5378257.1 hypothetical protein [Exiguobacterium mexicanum]
MDREARTEALLQIYTTYRRFMIGSSVVIFVSALYFMMHTTYSGVIAVASLVPTLFFEWKQTVLYLRFNDDWTYRRLVKGQFFILVATFLTLFSLITLFLTGQIHPDVLMWAMVIGAPPSVLLPLWMDRKLLKLDPEHVTSNMLAKANREKLKRRLDGIND